MVISSNEKACPDRRQLVEFLTGHLSERSLESIEDHLNECAPCGETIRALRVDDTLFRIAKQAKPLAEGESHLVNHLVSRFQKMSVPTDKRIDEESSFDVEARAEEVRCRLDAAVESDEIGCLSHYRILRLLGAVLIRRVVEAG